MLLNSNDNKKIHTLLKKSNDKQKKDILLLECNDENEIIVFKFIDKRQ